MEACSLPFNIIYDEILSRTSLETLAVARTISEETKNYTYSSHFMHLYRRNTKTQHGYFLQSCKRCEYVSTFISSGQSELDLSLDFLPFPVKIEASSKDLGLLFCMDQESRGSIIPPRYCVCKPTTKQWRLLPNPKTRYLTKSTAIIVLKSKPLWFKIIRLSAAKTHFNLVCEVFDSKNWAWKRHEDREMIGFDFLMTQPPAKACGNLHWFTAKYNVLAFDPIKELWTFLMLPQEFYDKNDNGADFPKPIQLCDYNGKLALLKKEDSTIDYWVMEDYSNQEWSKKESLIIKAISKITRHAWPNGFCDGETALLQGFKYLMFYKFTDGSIILNEVKDDIYCMFSGFDVFPIQADLEPCDLLNGKH